jgi:hypothetical protein
MTVGEHWPLWCKLLANIKRSNIEMPSAVISKRIGEKNVCAYRTPKPGHVELFNGS